MNNIAGALYRVIKITKTNEVQPENEAAVSRQCQFKQPFFKRLRKVSSDGASLTAGGRLFQARAAATGNARSPIVERLVDLTTRVGESADRS